MYYILLFLFITINSANADAISVEFHLPQTEAEKSLNKIFQNNTDLIQCLTHYYDKKIQQNIEHCRLFFTDELMKIVATYEKSIINGNNGNGTAYNILSCTMSFNNNHFLFNTIKTTKNQAYIKYIKNNAEFMFGYKQITTYKVIKQKNKWKLEGIFCSCSYGNFNYPVSQIYTLGLCEKPKKIKK